MSKSKAKWPHHNKEGRAIAERCITSNPRLNNNHCEYGCEVGSPNCAYHVQMRECSAFKLEVAK